MFQVTTAGETEHVEETDRTTLGTVYADLFMLRPDGTRVPLSREPYPVGRLTL